MVFIYRQEILKDIRLFTSQPKAKFYDELFINLDLSCIPAHNSKTGRASYSNHAMICAFIVMKCEGFSQISDLHDFLSNNLIIAYCCGFDITRELPCSIKIRIENIQFCRQAFFVYPFFLIFDVCGELFSQGI